MQSGGDESTGLAEGKHLKPTALFGAESADQVRQCLLGCVFELVIVTERTGILRSRPCLVWRKGRVLSRLGSVSIGSVHVLECGMVTEEASI